MCTLHFVRILQNVLICVAPTFCTKRRWGTQQESNWKMNFHSSVQEIRQWSKDWRYTNNSSSSSTTPTKHVQAEWTFEQVKEFIARCTCFKLCNCKCMYVCLGRSTTRTHTLSHTPTPTHELTWAHTFTQHRYKFPFYRHQKTRTYISLFIPSFIHSFILSFVYLFICKCNCSA